jgi:hypothetical protein
MLASMSVLNHAAFATHSILADTAPAGPEHPGINPPLNGAIVLGVLLLLLFVTTRLNRDK